MKYFLICLIAFSLCACSSDDYTSESFNVVNETSYELQITFKLSPDELDASDRSNYDNDTFVAENNINERVSAGETLTFYTISQAQHATWAATGPPHPDNLFEVIYIEALQNGIAISNAGQMNFVRFRQELATPGEKNISGSEYEYTATIQESDLQFR